MTRRVALAAVCLLALTACGGTARRGVAEAPALPAAQERGLYMEVIAGLRARGLSHAALAHLDAFERQHEPSAASRLLRAELLAELRQSAAAAEAFGRITSGPELAAARAGMGGIAARAERWDEAVVAFGEAVRLEPTNARFVNNLGYSLLRAGHPEQAELRLRMAAELDPASPEIRNNMALLLYATNRRAEAERLLALVPNAEARSQIRNAGARLQLATRPERRS